MNWLRSFLTSELVDQLRWENNQIRLERDRYLDLLFEKGHIIDKSIPYDGEYQEPLKRTTRTEIRRGLEKKYLDKAIEQSKGESPIKEG